MGIVFRACALFPDANLPADFAINDVRDLALRSSAAIRTALPPERLQVFADPPAGIA